MANEIDPGTISCVSGTLSGDIYDAFAALIDPADLPQLQTALQRIAFSVASGWVSNVVNSLTDTKFLQVDAGVIVGGDPTSGTAPSGAEYITASADGTLTAERVATNTTTVTWDFATPGQAKASVPDATTTSKGAVELATDGEGAAGVVVQGNDSRLSDARTPTVHATSHQNGGSDELDLTGMSGLLATAQTPASHATSHQNGGGDEISVAGLSGVLADNQNAIPADGIDTSAFHSNQASEIAALTLKLSPTTADLMVIEDSAAGQVKKVITIGYMDGLLDPALHASTHENGGGDEINVGGLSGLLADNQNAIPADGIDTSAIHDDTAGEIAAVAAKGSPTISDYLLIEDAAAANAKKSIQIGNLPAAAPAAHATSHQSGGSDAIKLDDLATPDDNTDLNASATRHGLLPKLSNGTYDFLRGDGTWAQPRMTPLLCDAASGYAQSGLTAATFTESSGEKPVVSYPNGSTTYYSWFKQIPEDYAGGGLDLRLWWSGSSSTTTNVLWYTYIESLTSGQFISSTNTFTASLGAVSYNGSTNRIGYDDLTRSHAQLDSVPAGGWIRILLARLGGSGSDTYTGSAYVLGFQLSEP